MSEFINEYNKSQELIMASLFGLPQMKSLDGFLYYHYSRRIQTSLSLDERHQRLDCDNQTYKISKEEEESLINGGFENSVKSAYEGFHNILRSYFVQYQNRNDIDMFKTFARAIHFLRNQEEIYPYREGTIISKSLNKDFLLSILVEYIKELIAELEWRMDRVNPNNHFDYTINDEEIKRYFKAIYIKSFNLLDKHKFLKNSNEIYERLVPKYIHPRTTVEQMHKLFSGNSEIFSERIVWGGHTNELRYFLRLLKDKLAKKQIFKLGEMLFENAEGEKFTNLNNTSTLPNSSLDLDEIISLF